MSTGDRSVHLDTNLLIQLCDVLELRQKDDFDEERAASIRALKGVRNRLAHGVPITDTDVRITALLLEEHLRFIERTSLGTGPSRRLRRASAPADIAEVLRRSEG